MMSNDDYNQQPSQPGHQATSLCKQDSSCKHEVATQSGVLIEPRLYHLLHLQVPQTQTK